MLLSLGKLHYIGDFVDLKTFLLGKWLYNVPGISAGRSVTHDIYAHILLGGRTAVHGTNSVLWQTHLDSDTKRFPGKHPLHGEEIMPATVLLNTFLFAAPSQAPRKVSLRSPIVVGQPREVQVVLNENEVRILSRLIGIEAGIT